MQKLLIGLFFLLLLTKGKGSKRMDGLKNNNPGNIKYDGIPWLGQIGTAPVNDGSGGRYVVFKSMNYGVRAIAKNALTTQRSYPTFNEFFKHYASGNAGPYAAFVAAACGVQPDSVINFPAMLPSFVTAQINFENSHAADKGLISSADINNGINLA